MVFCFAFEIALTLICFRLKAEAVSLPYVILGELVCKLDGRLSHCFETRGNFLGLQVGLDDKQHILNTVFGQDSFIFLEVVVPGLGVLVKFL